jgi:hypothetical protein
MTIQASSQINDRSEDNMHGAAVVNDKGEETPITEDMIKSALESIVKTN